MKTILFVAVSVWSPIAANNPNWALFTGWVGLLLLATMLPARLLLHDRLTGQLAKVGLGLAFLAYFAVAWAALAAVISLPFCHDFSAVFNSATNVVYVIYGALGLLAGLIGITNDWQSYGRFARIKYIVTGKGDLE